MIMPSDKDYRETKRLKKSGRPLPSPYRELADWIASAYGVQVLNIRYETVIPDSRPRLNVILEWERDQKKFTDRRGNFDQGKENQIREQFERLLVEQRVREIETERLFVIFSAFERVARIEANEKVTEADLDRLKRALANPDLWHISRLFDSATFFFYTIAQAEGYEVKGLRTPYAEEYLRLVKPHDEFGYVARTGILVTFDSKENFDTNYQSNWFYYYR